MRGCVRAARSTPPQPDSQMQNHGDERRYKEEVKMPGGAKTSQADGLRLHREIGTLESLKHGDVNGVDGGEWTRRSGLDGDVCRFFLHCRVQWPPIRIRDAAVRR